MSIALTAILALFSFSALLMYFIFLPFTGGLFRFSSVRLLLCLDRGFALFGIGNAVAILFFAAAKSVRSVAPWVDELLAAKRIVELKRYQSAYIRFYSANK